MAGQFAGTATFAGKGSAYKASTGAFAGVATFRANIASPLPACAYLLPRDLENSCGGAAVVDRLFDYNGDSLRDWGPLAQAMRAAEDHAASYLLKSFTQDEIAIIGREDLAFRNHVAWVALELGAEMHPEFNAADGKGRFWAQYTRANEHFDRLCKNKAHTVASDRGAGKGANSGGAVSPALSPSTAPRFTFVPDANNPRRGGF